MLFFNSNNFCYILNMFKSYTGGKGCLYIHKIAIFLSKPVVKIIYTYTHCNL